jgi:hypothetical protein
MLHSVDESTRLLFLLAVLVPGGILTIQTFGLEPRLERELRDRYDPTHTRERWERTEERLFGARLGALSLGVAVALNVLSPVSFVAAFDAQDAGGRVLMLAVVAFSFLIIWTWLYTLYEYYPRRPEEDGELRFFPRVRRSDAMEWLINGLGMASYGLALAVGFWTVLLSVFPG